MTFVAIFLLGIGVASVSAQLAPDPTPQHPIRITRAVRPTATPTKKPPSTVVPMATTVSCENPDPNTSRQTFVFANSVTAQNGIVHIAERDGSYMYAVGNRAGMIFSDPNRDRTFVQLFYCDRAVSPFALRTSFLDTTWQQYQEDFNLYWMAEGDSLYIDSFTNQEGYW